MSQTLSGQQHWMEMDWKTLEFPMQSPGIEHAIKFRQAQSTHDIVVEKLVQIQEDQCLLMGSDREYPNSIGLHLLQKSVQFGITKWTGFWHSDALITDLPEYRTLELVKVWKKGSQTILIWDVWSEMTLGVYMVSLDEGKTQAESFLNLQNWNPEIEDWEGVGAGLHPKAGPKGLVWRLHPGVYRMEGKVYANDDLALRFSEGKIESDVNPPEEREIRRCLAGNYNYERLAGNHILTADVIGQGEAGIAKICTAIAEQEGMEQFFLFAGRVAFEHYYTPSVDGDQDGNLFVSGCLGEWRDGKLQSFE